DRAATRSQPANAGIAEQIEQYSSRRGAAEQQYEDRQQVDERRGDRRPGLHENRIVTVRDLNGARHIFIPIGAEEPDSAAEVVGAPDQIQIRDPEEQLREDRAPQE